MFQEFHSVDGFFSPVYHTVPGEPTLEPYMTDMDIYDDHATIWAPCPDIPYQTTAAEATFGQTGEGYLSFVGLTQQKTNTIPVGYASGIKHNTGRPSGQPGSEPAGNIILRALTWICTGLFPRFTCNLQVKVIQVTDHR